MAAERRPDGGGIPDAGNVETSIGPADDEIAELLAGLRRRREASWRLPPLADGCRDPLDRLRSAS
jgi:hypothetical protein